MFTLLLTTTLAGNAAETSPTLHRDARHGKVIFITVPESTEQDGSSPRVQSIAQAASVPRPATLAISDPGVLAEPEWSGTIAAAWAFMDQYSVDFGEPSPRDNLVVYRAERDRIGMAHVRFRQHVDGVPVMGGDLVVHLDSRDQVRSAGGRFAPPTGLNAVPSLSSNQAMVVAMTHWPHELPADRLPEVLRVELKVFSPGLAQNDGNPEQFLVWDVWLGATCGVGCGSRAEEAFYVDAHTGELRGKLDLVQGLDRKIYDCTAKMDGTCWSEWYDEMFDYTFGRREGRPFRGPNPRLLPEISTDVDDAYDLIGSVRDYLLERFGRDGANGQGGTGNNSDANHPYTRTVVNTYIDYGNGSAACPYGAAFFWDSSNMGFCKDTIVPDIVAHEYMHALSYHVNVLDSYGGESAALNEANSDILGLLFECFHLGSTRWIFMGTLPDEAHPRSLAAPPSTIIPGTSPIMRCADRFHSPHVHCGSSIQAPYNKATIPGKAAYLLAEGDYFNGCTVRAIGVERLEQIWYRALTQYFTSSETFNGAYAKLQQAAADLYPGEPDTLAQVRRAFQAVELDQPGKCSGQPARVPQALDVQGW